MTCGFLRFSFEVFIRIHSIHASLPRAPTVPPHGIPPSLRSWPHVEEVIVVVVAAVAAVVAVVAVAVVAALRFQRPSTLLVSPCLRSDKG